MDLELERSLVAATLDCLGRKARENQLPQHVRRAAEHLDDARRHLELAARADLPSEAEDVDDIHAAV